MTALSYSLRIVQNGFAVRDSFRSRIASALGDVRTSATFGTIRAGDGQ